jgi:6,7-dimethyl-8-ribityllumazine synthase
VKKDSELGKSTAGIAGEQTGLTGPLPAGKIAVVVSRYNAEVCDSMGNAAVETLRHAGITENRIEVQRVPGAWELPLVVSHWLSQPGTVAAIALGVVIRGETTHDEHINRAVSMALMQISLDTGKPLGFGLLTCNTPEQASARAGGNVGNKGIEAAEAVLELLRLLK